MPHAGIANYSLLSPLFRVHSCFSNLEETETMRVLKRHLSSSFTLTHTAESFM
jgi:hypothetical protein